MMRTQATAWPVNLVEARKTFGDLRVVHVGSVLADGSPHVVPLWFVWLEDAVFVTSRRGTRLWANVKRDPRVVLEFDRGRAWNELGGVLVHGRAEALRPEDPASRRALSAWFDKYRGDLGGGGFALYAEDVPHPVLLKVRPDRLVAWLHGRR
jgi:hypothetical protein